MQETNHATGLVNLNGRTKVDEPKVRHALYTPKIPRKERYK